MADPRPRLFAHVARKSLNKAGHAPDSATTNFTIELDLPGLIATAMELIDDAADPYFDVLVELAGLDARDKAAEWSALEVLKRLDAAFFEERKPEPPAWYDFDVEMTYREDDVDYVKTGYVKIIDARADPVAVRFLATESVVWATLTIARSALGNDRGKYVVESDVSIRKEHLHPPLRARLR